jgi:hypothetical protein
MSEAPDDDVARLGDAFPAGDLIAQFVLVTRAQRDDLTETVTEVVRRIAKDDSKVHYYHRLLVSHYFEAMKWFADAAKDEAIRAWLDGFSDEEITSAIAAALATTGPKGLVKTRLWAGRQTTFHYPRVEIDGGLQETIEALADLPLELSVEGNEYGTYPRALFVEEIFTHRLLAPFADDVDATLKQIRDAAIAYVQLADACLSRYMDERGLSFGPPVRNAED